jgi:CRP-like cAMP-binding protein
LQLTANHGYAAEHPLLQNSKIHGAKMDVSARPLPSDFAPRQAAPFSNQVLQELDAAAKLRLHPVLKPVTFEPRQILYHPGERIRQVYFPETAVLCMLTLMRNGNTIETATVGNEGACWICAGLSRSSMPSRTIVAVEGFGSCIDAEILESEMARNRTFRRTLERYSHALLLQSVHSTACNALHSLLQRCSRWLLTTLDGSGRERFAVTQEFLASLLGASRPVLTGIVGTLERSGAIAAQRGFIRVIDRAALEACACECYGLIRENYASARAA